MPFSWELRMHHTCFLARCLNLPMPRPPPGGSLGTPKTLGMGATFHLGLVHLHVDNWECHAQKWPARCQKFAVPCRFFSGCKWGLRDFLQEKKQKIFEGLIQRNVTVLNSPFSLKSSEWKTNRVKVGKHKFSVFCLFTRFTSSWIHLGVSWTTGCMESVSSIYCLLEVF